ncbi:MAG TPA: hypothetical protein VJU77_15940 [Chthoniobacterales bacterium]|nr:hypothetical protein [Chthoniobacterales bacterium]
MDRALRARWQGPAHIHHHRPQSGRSTYFGKSDGIGLVDILQFEVGDRALRRSMGEDQRIFTTIARGAADPPLPIHLCAVFRPAGAVGFRI